MRDHRVPLLGDAWRRSPDPERSTDPRVQLVLAGLRELSAGPAPEPTFRAELRAQLVAIAPRIVAEGDVDAVPQLPGRAARTVARAASSGAPLAVGAGSGSGRSHVGFGAVSVRRVAAATTCTVVAMAMLLGVALFLSRNSVPGDALYGLKRAGENFQLATDSSSEKPHDLLRFATRRVDEAQTLASRGQASAAGSGISAAGTVNSGTSRQIQDALASADSDLRQAARMLGAQAVDSADAAPLTTLTAWAPSQLSKLRQLWTTLGAGSSATPDVTKSVNLVTSAQNRAAALGAKVDCGCLKTAPSDSLGPKPCATCAPAASTTHQPGSKSTTVKPGTGSGSGSQGGTGNGRPAGNSSHGPAAPPATGNGGGILPTSVPTTLPVTIPTAPKITPVAVSSCGVAVQVGGLKLDLGSCKTS